MEVPALCRSLVERRYVPSKLEVELIYDRKLTGKVQNQIRNKPALDKAGVMSGKEQSGGVDSIPEECSANQEARSTRDVKLEYRDD